VYVALVNFLEKKKHIHTGSFDTTICRDATIADINAERIKWFIEMAQAKRGFPLSTATKPITVLTHLNLTREASLTNALYFFLAKTPTVFYYG